jgi:crossover junction endodeoxyribonuclease RuvC
LERVGWGVIDRRGSKIVAVAYGLISTPRVETPLRLLQIYEDLSDLIETYQPNCIATERLLFTVNKTTAMDVAKALGVIQLSAVQKGLSFAEYSPPEIKQTVVGVGNAEKKQVQFMVTKLLSLAETPKPDDVADALAIGISHALKSGPLSK